MAQNTSYPSPNSAQMGEGPFYASQHQLPVAEDVQTSAPQSHRAPPTTGGRDGETDERAPTVRNTQQLAQSGLESAQTYDQNDPASRKRTKVSRACDECRRKKVRSLLRWLFRVYRCADYARYAATLPLRLMERNAQAVNVPIFFVCSAERHKREAQVKGKAVVIICTLPSADHEQLRYIKELAERVGALEGRRPMPPMPGYQYGAYNEYSPQPEELGYGPRKRTHSMSEGLQGPTYAPERESLGRFPPAASVEWSGRDTARQMSQASPNYAATSNNDQPSTLNNPETPAPFARRGSNQAAMDVTNALGGRQTDQGDVTFEWDEYAVEE